MIRPVTMLETTSPPTMKTVISPAWVGLMPRAIWKYWLRYTVAPNIATPTISDAPVARAVVRSRKRRSGMIGSAATRAST